MQTPISFNISDDDRALIARIVDRMIDVMDGGFDRPMSKAARRDTRINLMMDLTACHANGNPLRLADLAAANDFNIAHDVGGISRHICRDTGKLLNCFSPRFSQRELAVSA